MNEKKLTYLLVFLMLASAALITPVVLPYFTLEKSSTQQLNGLDHNELHTYIEKMKASAERNKSRLETSLFFAKIFIPTFVIFVMSTLGLLSVFALKLLYKFKKYKDGPGPLI